MEKTADVKGLKMAYEAALTAREDAGKAITTLEGKVSTLEEELDHSEESLKTMEEEKRRLLIAHGQVGGKDLQTIRGRIRDFRDQFEDTKELLTATTKALKETRESIVKLDAGIMGARHTYLYALGREEEEKIRASVKDALYRAWLLCLDAGGYSTYEGFLRRIFPQPSLEEILKMRKNWSEI